jgi:hypothetical protein
MKFLIILLLMLPQIIRAQSMGHPGGGDPLLKSVGLSGMPRSDWLCLMKAGKAHGLEKEFTEAWGKKYKSSDDFTNLMDNIAISPIINSLIKFNLIKSSPQYLCEKKDSFEVNRRISRRPNYQHELKLLKDLQAIWEAGINGMKNANNCTTHFKKRSSHINELKLLIKTYEKSSSQ